MRDFTIGDLALGLYLLFVGLTGVTNIKISATVTDWCALIAGIIFLVSFIHPIRVWGPRRPVQP